VILGAPFRDDERLVGVVRIDLDADNHDLILTEVLHSVALVGGELFADRLELAVLPDARLVPREEVQIRAVAL